MRFGEGLGAAEQRLIGGGKFAINKQNLCCRFGFGTQNDTGLVVPGERGKRTVVQSLTMAVLSLSKPLSLNRLSRLEERFSSILPSPGLSQNT
jgi:hypothetical protein